MDGYEATFAKFDRAGGYVWQWNWASFLFGPLWYLYKGMLPKALLYFVVTLLVGVLIPGVGAVVVWAALGVLGSYDLYLLHRFNTQMYSGANFQPWKGHEKGVEAASDHSAGTTHNDPGVNGFAEAAQNQASLGRRKTLDEMLADGLLTAEEYEAKLAWLSREEAVHHKLTRLDDALRNGVITQQEYDEKKSALIA